MPLPTPDAVDRDAEAPRQQKGHARPRPEPDYAVLMDPALTAGFPARPLGGTAPVETGFRVPAAPQAIVADAPARDEPAQVAEDQDQSPAELPLPPVRDFPVLSAATAAPLPVPRPSGLARPDGGQPRIAEQSSEPRPPQIADAGPAGATTASDNRSFLEKLFGGQTSTGPVLAYASPQDAAVDGGRSARLGLAVPSSTGPTPPTAVYDISSHTVYLPNGERLEAHSGLGNRKDNPTYVNERMRGPTPPHVYDLTLREKLFHGVQAIRLNPVGGSAAVHGRVGLLAHTYMLGPNGDSNGCISFRDYNRFLQAYLRGEVRRLVVVARAG